MRHPMEDFNLNIVRMSIFHQSISLHQPEQTAKWLKKKKKKIDRISLFDTAHQIMTEESISASELSDVHFKALAKRFKIAYTQIRSAIAELQSTVQSDTW